MANGSGSNVLSTIHDPGMIDVLLVNPKEKDGFFEKMPPLGLAYIAAILEQNNYAVKIVDFEVEAKDVRHWLEKLQPKILGISGTSHTRHDAFRLAKEAKEFSKEIITVYGGVHATFTAVDTLKNINEIDYVVRGEGEGPMLALARVLSDRDRLDLAEGISYRRADEIIENSRAPRVMNLDVLPRPAYHLLDMGKYSVNMEFVNKKGISTITSRGCQARCSFCSASRMFDHQVSYHSAQYVIDQIEALFRDHGFQGVKIFDSTLTIKRAHIEAFCDEILQRGFVFPWECEIRVGTVDQRLLEKMMSAGCYYVNFGIESASQRVLNLMRKGFTVDQAEELLALCRRIGLKTKVFFSFGHIGETMDDVEKTFAFIEKHQHQITTIASGAGVRIYPGTYLEDHARKNGLLPEGFQWSRPYQDERLERIFQTKTVPVLVQPQLGYPELEEIALRIYSKRFSGWKGFKRGLQKITQKEKIKKLWRLMKLRARKIAKAKAS